MTRTLVLALVALSYATPASADTSQILHASVRPIARGDERALNPQPIPPGRTRPISRNLDARSLNPQPIPPGHTMLGNGPPIMRDAPAKRKAKTGTPRDRSTIVRSH